MIVVGIDSTIKKASLFGIVSLLGAKFLSSNCIVLKLFLLKMTLLKKFSRKFLAWNLLCSKSCAQISVNRQVRERTMSIYGQGEWSKSANKVQNRCVCVQGEGVSVGFDRALYLLVQMDRVIC